MIQNVTTKSQSYDAYKNVHKPAKLLPWVGKWGVNSISSSPLPKQKLLFCDPSEKNLLTHGEFICILNFFGEKLYL